MKPRDIADGPAMPPGGGPIRVAIIGGGLAGMAAAEALARHGQGISLTLFEARRHPGGRAGSFVDPGTGDEVDYCQHVAMGCCSNLIKLLEDCQIVDPWIRYDALTFHHPRCGASHFAASHWLPPPFHLGWALARLRYLTWVQKFQIATASFRLMRTPPGRLEQTTAADWLRGVGQSVSTIRDYWDVVLVSALGESSQNVSMAAARKVFIDGFLAVRGASDVLVPKRPLGELFGVQLPDALRRLGLQVRSGAPVRRLRFGQGEGSDRGALALESEGASIDFDRVIVAVPWHQIGRLVDPLVSDRAGLAVADWSAFPSSPITGVHLWFDREITAAPHAVFVGTLAQWLFRRPFPSSASAALGIARPGERGAQQVGHYYQVVISASRGVRQSDQQEVVRQVVADLATAFPAVGTARLLASRVVTDPQAVFSVSPAVEASRPAASTLLPSLHLAGDYTRTGWPATMEGAVISGRLAAASLLRSLGRPTIDPDPGLPRPLLSRWLIQ